MWQFKPRIFYCIFTETPQIIDIFTSSNTIKKEGDPLELTCDASGIPKPVISWTMVGGGVLPTGGRELTVSYILWCMFPS